MNMPNEKLQQNVKNEINHDKYSTPKITIQRNFWMGKTIAETLNTAVTMIIITIIIMIMHN